MPFFEAVFAADPGHPEGSERLISLLDLPWSVTRLQVLLSEY
jgi:hypothetical protein